MENYGLLQVYTGDGKGKTTAALGIALRAVGKGAQVMMLSFLKDDPLYGEAIAFKYLPGFILKQVGRDAFVNFKNPSAVDLELAQKGWETAKKIIESNAVDILILDEFTLLLATKMLPIEEVINFLKQRVSTVEIIITGRNAPQELIEIADLVTNMQEIKHYFHQGMQSRDGIDH